MTPKVTGVTSFLCIRFMCHCVTAVSAYTSAGPLSLKQNGDCTSVITSVHTIDDEDEHHVPHKDILESRDDELTRSARATDAWPAVRSMLWTLIRVFAEQLPLLLAVKTVNQETCVTCPLRTLYEVLRNNSYRGGIACFGEVVWALVPGTRLVRGKFEVNWPVLVWLGKRENSDEHLYGDEHGVRKFRTIRRQPESARWRREDVEKLMNDPFNAKPKPFRRPSKRCRMLRGRSAGM